MQGVSLTKVSEDWLEVKGWAKEPFILTEASTRRSIERTLSRRDQYTPADFARHLGLYQEAVALMGWVLPPEMLVQMEPPTVPPPMQMDAYAAEKFAEVPQAVQAVDLVEEASFGITVKDESAEPQPGRSWLDDALSNEKN